MPDYDWTHSVHHDGSPRYVVSSELSLGSTVTISLRADVEAPIERVFLRTCPDGEQKLTAMNLTSTDSVCRWWETNLQLSMPSTNYRFLLLTSEGGWWLTAAGMVRYTPTDATDFKILAHYHTPTWVRESVFYEIFPDRFADGDPSNNMRDGEYLCYGRPVIARQWGERPSTQRGEGGI